MFLPFVEERGKEHERIELNTRVEYRLVVKIKKKKKKKKKKKRRRSYLAALVVEDTFRILEHLLPPQVEKVVGIRVELEAVLTIVPVE